jgi:hypothetical protein
MHPGFTSNFGELNGWLRRLVAEPQSEDKHDDGFPTETSYSRLQRSPRLISDS